MIKIYKYHDLISIIATVGWLSFIYSAFMGFEFWYLGFVVFFWISLGIINYRHETTLWLLKNRSGRFSKYYFFLIILGFFGDYVIGQKLTNLWNYPPYNSFYDWLRLYLFIYPIGGLSIIELIYFLVGIFKQQISLGISKDNYLMVRLGKITDILLIATILVFAFSKLSGPLPYIRNVTILLFIIWCIIGTFKLKYQVKHWKYLTAIVFISVFLSMFLHEIPNTAVYEWRYYPPALLDNHILNITIWVFFGWYLMVLLMFKFWIRLVLLHHRK